MIVFYSKINLVSRYCFGFVLITLLITEITEALLFGFINAFNYDVFVLSLIGLILTVFENKFAMVPIHLILGYFIWKLSTEYFPSYPEYQAFTYLLKLIGINSLKAQKDIHIVVYSSLILSSLFPKKKKV
jgi:hypothetical protein